MILRRRCDWRKIQRRLSPGFVMRRFDPSMCCVRGLAMARRDCLWAAAESGSMSRCRATLPVVSTMAGALAIFGVGVARVARVRADWSARGISRR